MMKMLTGILAIGAATVAGLLFVQPASAYNANQINARVPDARAVFSSVEETARKQNQHAVATCGDTRSCLNSPGMAYWVTTWISPQGQPNVGTALTLPSTTTSVPLQLNTLHFLTAATASRNSGTNQGLGTINYNANASNFVKSSTFPNDTRSSTYPAINVVARTAQRSKIYSASVVSGGGSLSGVATGTVIGTTRDLNSRYWFSNAMNFTYNSGAWTGEKRKVTIRFEVASISTYHANPPAGTSQCSSGGRVITVGSNQFDRCDKGYVNYSFTFFVTPVWEITPSVVVDKATAAPDETVTWRHTVKNEGPDNTAEEARYNYRSERPDGSSWGPAAGAGWTLALGTLPSASASNNSTYRPTQDDVDSTLCRVTVVSPTAWNLSTQTASSRACVTVPYNYALTPHVSTTNSSTVEGGSSVSASVYVDNSGPTKSKQTEWVVTMMEVAAGTGNTVPNSDGGNSAVAPCGTYFINGNTTCKVINSGNSVFGTNGAVISGDPLIVSDQEIDDVPVGTRICFALSLAPRSSGSNEWVHSAPTCVTVGKKPKVHVIGGDLSAGVGAEDVSDIMTATTVKQVSGQIRTFGSWTEYAVLTNGIVTGMGSGAAFNRGKVNSSDCNSSLLTFTNADDEACTSTGLKGNYSLSARQLDVKAAFPVNSSTPNYTNLSAASGRRVVTSSNPITISGGTIQKGDWLVINAPDQTVTITGNINYTTDTLDSIRDIPQLVIIANKIDIRGSVTNIDAWLIATGNDGSVNTCSDYATTAPLDVSRCSQMLTVNGPVVAESVYLRRTAGAGAGGGSSDPAEVFNVRPDAYLWSLAQTSDVPRITTVYTTELPPRF